MNSTPFKVAVSHYVFTHVEPYAFYTSAKIIFTVRTIPGITVNLTVSAFKDKKKKKNNKNIFFVD